MRRKRILDTTICALFLWLGLAGIAVAQDVARMDKVVQSYVDAREFMGAVLVARGGKILFSKAYGSASLELNVPNTTTTKFRLGSITKQFTAASVLLLEEHGVLKVEDLVKVHYPDAPPAWDQVTLLHLLSHTSGIPNFTAFPDYQSLAGLRTTPDELVKRFRDRPLEFAPGTEMRYSNSGYVLLGAIIEKVSGKSYAKFVDENFFKPLGMKDSGYDSNKDVIARRAAGYVRGPTGLVNADYLDMTIPHAAGALYSTTEDLLRWETALFGRQAVSSGSLRKMTTPVKNDYAFGLAVSNDAGPKFIHHGGGIDGFNTHLTYYPDRKITVVALSNLNGPGADRITEKLGRLAHGEAVVIHSELREVPVPVDVLGKYVGTYALNPKVNNTITLDGDRLATQLTGQQKFPLYALSPTSFFLKAVEAQLDFRMDASGKVTSLVQHQNGGDRVATRISDTILARREITLPPETLAQFVGSYELWPGHDVVIAVDGKRLTLTASGQAPDFLLAESANLFFYERIDAQIEFVRDANGAVTHLIQHLGTLDRKAPKKT